VTATVVLVVVGYVVGSMPWGYWLVRAFRGDDIREHGSGNIGASNVWRAYGWRLGLPAAALDAAKGFVPVLVATQLVGYGTGVLVGIAAMLGHARPLFLGFRRGGKTVATAGGAILGLAPPVGLAALGVWLLLFAATRYASVASMVAVASMPLTSWLLGYPWPVIAFASFATVAVVVLHRANIRRLLHGKEPRFRLRRKRTPTASASL
jgi:glycerol-3-phosphate acyltransferase PlsY